MKPKTCAEIHLDNLAYNYREIQKLPYWGQVVEQQFEYNLSLYRDLLNYCPKGFIELWYEDVCNDTAAVVQFLEKAFSGWGWKLQARHQRIPKLKPSSGHCGMKDDIKKIESYVKKYSSRFSEYIFTSTKQLTE